jgi:hypothetical protein
MTSLHDKHYMQTDYEEVTCVSSGGVHQTKVDPFYQVCDQQTLASIGKAVQELSESATDNKFVRFVFSDVMLSLAAEVRPDLIDKTPANHMENGFLCFRDILEVQESCRKESIDVDIKRLDKMSAEIASLKPVLAMYAHGAVLAGVSDSDKTKNLVGALALTPVNNGVEHKEALNWLKTSGVIKTDVVDPQNSKLWRQEALRLFIVPKCVTSPLVSGTWLTAASSKKRTADSQAENAINPSAKKPTTEEKVSQKAEPELEKKTKAEPEKKAKVSAAPEAEKKKAKVSEEPEAEKKKAKAAPEPEKKKAKVTPKKNAESADPNRRLIDVKPPPVEVVDDGSSEQKKRKSSAISTTNDFESEIDQLMNEIDGDAEEAGATKQNSSPQMLTIVDSFDKMIGIAEQFKWNAESYLAIFSQNLVLVPNRDFQMLLTLMREKQHDTEAIDKYMVAQHKENDRYTVAATQLRLPTNPLASIFSCARVSELTASHLGNAAATLTCHEKIVAIQRQAMQKYVSEDAECLRKMTNGGEMAILHILFSFLRLDRRLNGRTGEAAFLESAATPDGLVPLNQDELPMGTGFSCGPIPMQLLKKMWERYCAEIGFKRTDTPEQFMAKRAALTLPTDYTYFTKYWDESFTPTPAQVETYNSAILPIMYSLFPPLRLGKLPSGR